MTSIDIFNIKPFFRKHESKLSIEMFLQKLEYLYSDLDSAKLDQFMKRNNCKISKIELAKSIKHFLIVTDFLKLDKSLQKELMTLSKISVKLQKNTSLTRTRKGLFKKSLFNEPQQYTINNIFQKQKLQTLTKLNQYSRFTSSLNYLSTKNFQLNLEFTLLKFNNSLPLSNTYEVILKLKYNTDTIPRSFNLKPKPTRSGILPVIQESSIRF